MYNKLESIKDDKAVIKINNEYEVDLRIKEGAKVDEIIEIFERESLIVQMISTLKRYTNILICIAVIYIVIELCLQRYTILGAITSMLFIAFMIISIYIVAGEISYTYSKKIGGRKAKSLINKEEGIFATIKYNLKLMRKEEWKNINKILRVNHLDSISGLKELKEYYSVPRSKAKNEISTFIKTLAGIYLIPIVLGIISIYTAISHNLGLDQNIINLSYIVAVGIIIGVIAFITYIEYAIKKYSITNIYTVPNLEKFLVEIILNKEKNVDKNLQMSSPKR